MTTGNLTSPLLELPAWIYGISVTLMVLSFVFGISINIALIFVILQKKYLRTYMNVYFINLSASDMIICCVTLVIRASMFMHHNHLDKLVYQVDLFFQTLTDVVRMPLLIGVSIERHQAIASPFKTGSDAKWRTVLGCVTSWVVSVTLALFCAISYENSFNFILTGKSLTTHGDTESYFIIPLTAVCLIIIFVCYLAMLRHLYNHGNNMANIFRNKVQVIPEMTTISKAIDHHTSTIKNSKLLSAVPVSDEKYRETTLSTVPSGSGSINTNHASNVSIHEMDGTIHKAAFVVDGKVKKVEGAICVYDSKNRIQGKRRVEMRAAKKIAMVMGIFMLLWLPYPIAVMICKSLAFSGSVGECRNVLLILANISSLTAITNPLLYILTNKQLKIASRTYLTSTCKCQVKM